MPSCSMQCSCRDVSVMSVVCAKHILWYAEITNDCDMLNSKATNRIELVKLFDSCFYKKKCVGVFFILNKILQKF